MLMILLLHIVVALASIGYATLTFFTPSKAKLQASYGLVALTLASGTFLVASSGSHILEACTVGLVYIAGVSLALVAANNKLAVATRRINK